MIIGIDGNDANQTAGGLQCVEFTAGVTNSRIEGCYVHNGNLAGIKIDSASHYNKIINNNIYDNGTNGTGAGGLDLNGDHNLIQGNKFSSNLATAILPDGDYNIIDGNDFISVYKTLFPDGGAGTNYIFSNNSILTASSDGLSLNANNSSIIGNTICSN